MNKFSFLIGILIIYSCTVLRAQHCPFDGAHMIMIHVSDSLSAAIQDNQFRLYAEEVLNHDEKTCDIYPGRLLKQFVNIYTAAAHYGNTGAFYDGYLDRLEIMSLKEYKNYYVVILNSHEHMCYNDNMGIRHVRNYQIVELENSALHVLSFVPEDRIYSLCTSAGNWNRIKPVILL